MKYKIITILGPTAVGKSDLAVELALDFNGEVMSADSRQVYKGLDIGTGKITKEEMRGVPHHLLDVADPSEQYTVAQWKEDAETQTRDILSRGRLPIICGGTGQYIQAIVDNTSLPNVPPNATLRNELSKRPVSELFAILESKDPKRAESIDEHNPRRLVRAIEVAEALGEVPEIKSNHPLFNLLQIGIILPREEIRERIQIRLEKRLKAGMVAEVQDLHRSGLSYARMDELGLEYRYLAKYLQYELSLEEMKSKLETEIYRYAIRQLRWFKRDERIKWFAPTATEAIFSTVESFLSE